MALGRKTAKEVLDENSEAPNENLFGENDKRPNDGKTESEIKAETKKQLNASDDWETVSSQDGRVVILEEEGEVISGVYIGDGRDIPHGDDKTIGTVALVTIEGEIEKVIVPKSTVIGNTIDELVKDGLKPDGKICIRIVKIADISGKKYKNFKIQKRLATFEETARAGKFLSIS